MLPYLLGVVSGLVVFRGFAFGLIVGLVVGVPLGRRFGVSWKEVGDGKTQVKKNKNITNRVVSWSGWGVSDRW